MPLVTMIELHDQNNNVVFLDKESIDWIAKSGGSTKVASYGEVYSVKESVSHVKRALYSNVTNRKDSTIKVYA